LLGLDLSQLREQALDKLAACVQGAMDLSVLE
jgi:hypothetical protein